VQVGFFALIWVPNILLCLAFRPKDEAMQASFANFCLSIEVIAVDIKARSYR
jgi:hypothetical protein